MVIVWLRYSCLGCHLWSSPDDATGSERPFISRIPVAELLTPQGQLQVIPLSLPCVCPFPDAKSGWKACNCLIRDHLYSQEIWRWAAKKITNIQYNVIFNLWSCSIIYNSQVSMKSYGTVIYLCILFTDSTMRTWWEKRQECGLSESSLNSWHPVG